MKFICFSDVHQSDRPPEARKDNYTEAIWNKLEQIGEIIHKVGVDFAICAGDFFHRKPSTSNSHLLVRRYIEILKSWNIPVFGIAGSHDLVWNRIESLEKQPLGVMSEAGIVTLLNEHKEERAFYDNEEIKTVLHGFPDCFSKLRLSHFKVDNYKKILVEENRSICQIAVAHTFASMKSGDFFGNRVFGYDELLEVAPSVDIWVFGHWHKDQGVEALRAPDGRDVIFINTGALSRGAYNSENIQRIPKAVVIEVAPKEIKVLPVSLKVKNFSEIFDVEKREYLKKKEEETRVFLDELIKAKSEEDLSLDTEDLINSFVGKSDTDKKVKLAVEAWLERAELVND